MSAVFALVGVLVGVAISSAYSFWAVRRAELERAVVAGTLISDELKALLDAAQGPVELGRSFPNTAAEAWREHRQGLVLYIPHERFLELAGLLRRVQTWDWAGPETTQADRQRADDLMADLRCAQSWLADRTLELRAAHQAFILTPLIKYLRSSRSRHAQRRERSRA